MTSPGAGSLPTETLDGERGPWRKPFATPAAADLRGRQFDPVTTHL